MSVVARVHEELVAMVRHENLYTEYIEDMYQRSDKAKLEELARLRGYELETLKKLRVMYVSERGATLMHPKYEGHLREFGVLNDTNKPVFYGRWVIPIYNERGKVVNLVGYSNTSKIRYLYGKAKYYSRNNTLYGLENLDTVVSSGYAMITEGITDSICLRNLGYESVYSECGTVSTKYKRDVINRREPRVTILFPDRDEPGGRALRNWKYTNAVVVWADPAYKDIDEMCKKRPEAKEVLRRVVSEILEEAELGFISKREYTVRVKQK